MVGGFREISKSTAQRFLPSVSDGVILKKAMDRGLDYADLIGVEKKWGSRRDLCTKDPLMDLKLSFFRAFVYFCMLEFRG